MDEYIIINKSVLKQRIENLEKESVSFIPAHEATICYKKLDELKQILSQSTPLIPIVEKAFDAGENNINTTGNRFNRNGKQDYISNLKLDT